MLNKDLLAITLVSIITIIIICNIRSMMEAHKAVDRPANLGGGIQDKYWEQLQIADDHPNPLTYENLPEGPIRNANIRDELGHDARNRMYGYHLYVSIRDALPTEENPFPDPQILQDALTYKNYLKAWGGGDILREWTYAFSDRGLDSHSPWDGKWFESITGKLEPLNHFNKWMHGIYQAKQGTNYFSYHRGCDSNLANRMREEARPRDQTITVHPDGETVLTKRWVTNVGHQFEETQEVRGTEIVEHAENNYWKVGSKLSESTLGCVTHIHNGYDIEIATEFANHLHNGALRHKGYFLRDPNLHPPEFVEGYGIGHDGVERYSKYGFVIDARITLMRLVKARDEALKDPVGFISRLNSILSDGEQSVDIDSLISIQEETAFKAIPNYLPEHKETINTAKRLYNKINTKITILKANVENNLKTDSNPKPDINDLREAIDEIKSSSSNIQDYLIQFVADAEVEYDNLDAEYAEVYRYTDPIKGKIQLALPTDNIPFPDIEPLENLLNVAFNSPDSQRICGDPIQGCRRFLGETFSWEAEIQLEYLKNQEIERVGEREIAKKNAEESIQAYEDMNNNIVCVKDPSIVDTVPDPPTDTPNWSNGHGFSCADYESRGWCCGQGACPGHEWTLGATYKHPENNCTACNPSFTVAEDSTIIEVNDEPSGELFDHESCGPNEKARRVASYGRQQLAYSRMMMFNIIHMAYENEESGIITAGQLKKEKEKALEAGTKGIQGLRGPPGPKGEKGRKGLPGQGGAKGEKGLKGLPGEEGSKGEKGLKGIPGEKGGKGLPGEEGKKGGKGGKGSKGFDGQEGAKGLRGLPGLRGPPGAGGAGSFGLTKGRYLSSL